MKREDGHWSNCMFTFPTLLTVSEPTQNFTEIRTQTVLLTSIFFIHFQSHGVVGIVWELSYFYKFKRKVRFT